MIILFLVLRDFFYDADKFNAFILFFCGTILFRIYQNKKSQIMLFLFISLGLINLIGNFKIILLSLSIISGFLYLDKVLKISTWQKKI